MPCIFSKILLLVQMRGLKAATILIFKITVWFYWTL